MSRPVALIVDDEPDIRELLEITLGRMNIDTRSAATLTSARALLSHGPDFHFCLTDMRLPDGSGLELIEQISAEHPNLPVAMITAHGNMQSAIHALKAGAFDFVSKPIDLKVLRQLVEAALRLSAGRRLSSEPAASASDTSSRLLGESPAMRSLRQMIVKLARNQAPVHISGESGTGKELVARLIHEQSPRRERPFIAINCGAVPSELMESEFFGHKKGSFSGAIADKQGLFQAAEGGTLFLDEVADLPLHMQVKLLRAIQEKSIRPIGEQHELATDVRLISATHKSLSQLVQEGLFRQDLFYRINVIDLEIPPLRKRRPDIPLLIDFLLQRVASNNGIPIPTIEPRARQALCDYHFPGNIRELENILERAAALCEREITPEDLRLPETQLPEIETPDLDNIAQIGIESHLERIERGIITQALESTRWNRTAAAKRLGISFRALRYRLEKLGLDQGEEE